jgi:hypothetical protein
MVASRSRRFRPLLTLAPIALAMLAVACDKVPLTAPTGSTITLSAHATFVPLNGTATLTATVTEPAGTPVQNGTVVTFSTNIGSIDPAEARTHNGSCTVTFRAGSISGTATVRAVSGGTAASSGDGSATQSDEIELLVGAAAASRVLLNSSPGTVSAGGGTAILTATVIDENGNRLAGVPVTFVSSAGTLLNGTVLTDSNGEARTTLTTNTEARVTATAGGQSVDLTVPVNPAINVAISLASTGGSSSQPAAGQPATFTITASAASGGAPLRDVSVNWGDGRIESLGTPTGSSISVSHVYASPGTYSPTVIATDTAGQTTRASTTVTVVAASRPLVSLSLSSTSVTPGQVFSATVTVTQQSSTAFVDYVDFNFGDGVVKRVNGLQTTHSYGSAGNYNITATVRFTDGTTSTAPGVMRVQ